VGRASRPSFLFHALTGETPIPLFGNPPKFLRRDHGQRFYSNNRAAKRPGLFYRQIRKPAPLFKHLGVDSRRKIAAFSSRV